MLSVAQIVEYQVLQWVIIWKGFGRKRSRTHEGAASGFALMMINFSHDL
jgi:hypothetical protein